MLAWGRLITPILMSRCAARCSARMRRATDLPLPGAPVTRAKPPSPASWPTRQQKECRRAVTCKASAGTPLDQAGQQRRHAATGQARGLKAHGRLDADRLGGDRLQRSAQSAGVPGLVLREQPAEHGAGVLVDEMDQGEVPAGEAQFEAGEMAGAVRHLEAAA